MQGCDLFRRLGLVVVLSQALVLHGLAGAWAKAASAPESHGAASGYLCALSDPAEAPAQPLPAGEGSAHSDCLFMCTAAGGGATMLPAEFAWLSHRFVVARPVFEHLYAVVLVLKPSAMPARGPPTLV